MRKTQPDGLDCHYLSHTGYSDVNRWQYERWDYIAHLAPCSPALSLEVAHRSRARYLYCSSGAVYHETPDLYGLSKRHWEYECRAAKVELVIARLFTFYGEGLDDGKAITQFVKQAKAGGPLRIWGDGNTVRSYMHGSHMGKLLWAILLRGKAGEAYDVGSESPVTMLELARLITSIWPCPILIENGKDRVPYYMPKDAAKAWALLEF
jgi:nucleoside-diphosphate-sugar epimerase